MLQGCNCSRSPSAGARAALATPLTDHPLAGREPSPRPLASFSGSLSRSVAVTHCGEVISKTILTFCSRTALEVRPDSFLRVVPAPRDPCRSRTWGPTLPTYNTTLKRSASSLRVFDSDTRHLLLLSFLLCSAMISSLVNSLLSMQHVYWANLACSQSLLL